MNTYTAPPFFTSALDKKTDDLHASAALPRGKISRNPFHTYFYIKQQ
jgi:hypothetical protein